MQKCQTVILFLLGFRSVAGISVSSVNCGDICSAVLGSSYTLTCTWSGTLETGIYWLRDTNIISTCDPSGSCFPPGYSTGNYPNVTAAALTITSFNNATDTGLWECSDGTDPSVDCTLPVIATGSLQGECTRSGNSHAISCSGITSHGSPPVTLKLMDGSKNLGSTTSGGSVNSMQADATRKIYTCEVTGPAATCLSPKSVDVTCEAATPTSTSDSASTTTSSPTRTLTTDTTDPTNSKNILLAVVIPVASLVIIILVVIAICIVHKRSSRNEV